MDHCDGMNLGDFTPKLVLHEKVKLLITGWENIKLIRKKSKSLLCEHYANNGTIPVPTLSFNLFAFGKQCFASTLSKKK